MEYCSPVWACAPALTFLGFTLWKPRHFGTLVSPAVRLSLWASHSLTAGRSVVFQSSTVSSPVSPRLLLSLRFVPTTFPQGAQGPPTIHYCGGITIHIIINYFTLLVKLPKSRITAHLHSFIPLFSRLWIKLPHSVQYHSFLQAFKTAVHHHLLSSPIQILNLFYPR